MVQDCAVLLMRERQGLTRDQALEEYLVYQIGLFEYLQLFQIASEIVDGKYQPENTLGHGPEQFVRTLFNLSIGLFASLMDKDNRAINVFDVWVVLYPEKKQRIVEVWKKIEPHMYLIRRFRNDVAFHATKDLVRYLETRELFQAKKAEVLPAMQEFFDLAAELMKEQQKALPKFPDEIDPILKKARPSASLKEIAGLKSFFILR
jgi:hypothetical protein